MVGSLVFHQQINKTLLKKYVNKITMILKLNTKLSYVKTFQKMVFVVMVKSVDLLMDLLT